MLTGFQAEVIAFLTDGEIVCLSHVEGNYREQVETEDQTYWEYIDALEEVTGYSAISRYGLEESSEGRGEWCGQCGAELVEQAEDYCQEHDSWYSGTATDDQGDDFRYCEDALLEDVEAGTDTCSFPEVDPNPRASRWVPCGICGAGDGEAHDLAKHDNPALAALRQNVTGKVLSGEAEAVVEQRS